MFSELRKKNNNTKMEQLKNKVLENFRNKNTDNINKKI
jgi:hypothetical protein